MKASDMRKEVDINGAWVMNNGTGTIQKALGKRIVTVGDLVEGLQMINRQEDSLNNAKNDMEKLIAEAMEA